MLSVPHFQVVFTLPGVLRPWARRSPEVVYGALSRASAEVLAELGESRWKARLGVLSVLHTWSNDLGFHPHVHCLVTGGGLSTEGAGWVASRPAFLFPTRVMAALLRGKLLDALRCAYADGSLHDPAEMSFESALRTAYRQRWVVHVEAPEGRGVSQATKYLARYVRGVAISDARIVSMTATHVTYGTRRGEVTLEGPEFVRRFAEHVLPRRFRQTRYYGLYATAVAQTAFVDAWRAVKTAGLGEEDVSDTIVVVPRRAAPCCPTCGGVLQELSLPDVPWTRPWGGSRVRRPP